MAQNWAPLTTMTVKMDVATNENGNIATGEDTAAGKKTVSLNGIKADATFAQADKVYGAIMTDILGANYDKSTATRTMTGGVVDDGEG